ncbi:MAG: hypothetical protein HON90_02905 [Halobacteriovoraceae bacterium]|jgi:hypothetical protein|nr:hypothetical protein [Halobacteriovoraceae bacterium]
MKKILLLALFFQFSLTTLASNSRPGEFNELLRWVRLNFQNQNVSNEITQLEHLVQKNKIDLARYGLGRGIFDFWKEETLSVTQNIWEKNCRQSSQRFIQKSITPFTPRPEELIKYTTKNQVHLSVLSENEVQTVFKILFNHDDDIVFSEFGNSCESRAHAMAIIMDKMCINSGKAFVESDKIQIDDYNWSWSFHVAPIVLVKVNHKIVPYILDPSLFSQAVKLTKWINKLSQRNIDNTYDITFTKKYNYFPLSKSLDLDMYQNDDIDIMGRRLSKRYWLRFIRPLIKPL